MHRARGPSCAYRQGNKTDRDNYGVKEGKGWEVERRTSFQRGNRSGNVPTGLDVIDSLSHGSCSANGIIADIQFTALC